MIDTVTLRRGVDGLTPKPQKDGTDWGAKVMVAIVGDDDGTAEETERIAEAIVQSFNSIAVKPTFRYPKTMKVGKDLTTEPMAKPDQYLLDKDVIGLMQAAFPDHTLNDLKGFKDIMESFWTDPYEGASLMDAYVPDFAPGPPSAVGEGP